MPFATKYEPGLLNKLIAQQNAVALQNQGFQQNEQQMQQAELEAQLKQALQPLQQKKAELDIANAIEQQALAPLRAQRERQLIDLTNLEMAGKRASQELAPLRSQLEKATLTEALNLTQGPAAEKARQAKELDLQNDADKIKLEATKLALEKSQLEQSQAMAPELKAKALEANRLEGIRLQNEATKLQIEADQLKLATTQFGGGGIEEPADISKATPQELLNLATRFGNASKIIPGMKEKADFYAKAATEKMTAANKPAKMDSSDEKIVDNLSTKNANKISIANQIEADMERINDPANPDKVKLAIAEGMIKTLNSKEGADAVGAEESRRLASLLEFGMGGPWGFANWIQGKGDWFGRDFEGFKSQAVETMKGVRAGVQKNQETIDKILNKYRSTPSTTGSVSTTQPSQGEYKAGTKAIQGGKTYQFDGKKWNEIN